MAIDRQKIIDSLSNIAWTSNDNGFFEKCNVLITRLPSQFWNGFADRLVNKADPDLVEATEYLLYNAAHECGYHTGYGIMTSQEWREVIDPMIENTEDKLYGAYSVLEAWGWVNAEIIKLVPNKTLVIKAHDYYEADVIKYGKGNRLSAYMVAGISAALMELAYSGDYDPKGSPVGSFACKQIKGLECGDPCGEFIVTRTFE